jgi:hypothetical protein
MSQLTFNSQDSSGYDQVINRVRRLTTGLQGAIDGGPSGHSDSYRACLVDLHNRTRDIAAVLNQALANSRRHEDRP